jgi:hypothetical protein
MVHSTRGKLGELIGNPKDQAETLQKSNIYQIDCLGCSPSYIGQSRRSITTRFNDHHINSRKNHSELLSIADHAITHMNDPRSKHDINLDNFSMLKEVRRPDHLDAFESFYILKAKKEAKVLLLLNNDDGNVNSTLLLNLALVLFYIEDAYKSLEEVFCLSFSKMIRDKLIELFSILFFSRIHTCLLSQKMNLSQKNYN